MPVSPSSPIQIVQLDMMTASSLGGHSSLESQDPVALKAAQAEMLPLWKKFLLNQFHDVLPGSCIEQVHSSWKWSDHLCECVTL